MRWGWGVHSNPTGQLLKRKNGYHARHIAIVNGTRQYVCTCLNTTDEVEAVARMAELVATLPVVGPTRQPLGWTPPAWMDPGYALRSNRVSHAEYYEGEKAMERVKAQGIIGSTHATSMSRVLRVGREVRCLQCNEKVAGSKAIADGFGRFCDGVCCSRYIADGGGVKLLGAQLSVGDVETVLGVSAAWLALSESLAKWEEAGGLGVWRPEVPDDVAKAVVARAKEVLSLAYTKPRSGGAGRPGPKLEALGYEADLGVLPDSEIARQRGISAAAVHYARTRRGIPPVGKRGRPRKTSNQAAE